MGGAVDLATKNAALNGLVEQDDFAVAELDWVSAPDTHDRSDRSISTTPTGHTVMHSTQSSILA